MISPETKFPMPITTPRLILRPPTTSKADISEYVAAIEESINELRLWLPWAKNCPSTQMATYYVEACNANWITKNNNNVGLPLWVRNKETGEFLGNVVIWNIVWNVPKFELGFWLRSSQTKNGYITEAINAVTRYCFLELGVKRIEIRSEINNSKALEVPKRLGFDLDGILRNSARSVSDSKLSSTVIYSLTNIENIPKLEITWGDKKINSTSFYT